MIPRYSTPQMEKIWSTRNKYNIWLKIEILACEALENKEKFLKAHPKF